MLQVLNSIKQKNISYFLSKEKSNVYELQTQSAAELNTQFMNTAVSKIWLLVLVNYDISMKVSRYKHTF